MDNISEVQTEFVHTQHEIEQMSEVPFVPAANGSEIDVSFFP